MDDLFGRLHGALENGRPAVDARPLEIALTDLWNSTAEPMSPAWRQRFVHHLALQWQGTRTESVNRSTAHVPTLQEYPPLRRDSNGTSGLLDLVEPTLGIEIQRMVDMRAAAEAIPAVGSDLGLSDSAEDVARIVDVIVRTPRANIDWLLESRRYIP